MEYSIAIDTMWVLVGTALVLFMQAGFAMVETGFTRAKNAGNIIMKNIIDLSVGSIMFWTIGFSIMFGLDMGGYIGQIDLFSSGSFEHLGLNIPKEAFLIFQTVFCATAATIVSGAMAERTKFVAYIAYSIILCTIIYPVAGHWIWGGGWLAQQGFHDFAGSTTVHSLGGWAALVGAKIIGPRVGKYSKSGQSNVIQGHSITLGALGVFILWFGWFGFNAGSTLSGTDFSSISHIFLTTNLAAAAGTVSAMVISFIRYGKPDVSITLNGALGGLVAITAGTDIVGPTGAVIIGIIAGAVVIFSIEMIDKVLKIDDPVGAIAVHGLCGAVGTALVGIFAVDGGLLYGGGLELLRVQIIGIMAVAFWTLLTCTIMFKLIDLTIGLRVAEEEEENGLDIVEHNFEGYAS